MHLNASHKQGHVGFAQASWPLLESLDLSYDQLDVKAMQHIATGIWPNLQGLWLAKNPFGRRGLRYLQVIGRGVGLLSRAFLLLARCSKSTLTFIFWDWTQMRCKRSLMHQGFVFAHMHDMQLMYMYM